MLMIMLLYSTITISTTDQPILFRDLGHVMHDISARSVALFGSYGPPLDHRH